MNTPSSREWRGGMSGRAEQEVLEVTAGCRVRVLHRPDGTPRASPPRAPRPAPRPHAPSTEHRVLHVGSHCIAHRHGQSWAGQSWAGQGTAGQGRAEQGGAGEPAQDTGRRAGTQGAGRGLRTQGRALYQRAGISGTISCHIQHRTMARRPYRMPVAIPSLRLIVSQ